MNLNFVFFNLFKVIKMIIVLFKFIVSFYVFLYIFVFFYFGGN